MNFRGQNEYILMDTLVKSRALFWVNSCGQKISTRIHEKCPLEFTHFEKSVHENPLSTRILHSVFSACYHAANRILLFFPYFLISLVHRDASGYLKLGRQLVMWCTAVCCLAVHSILPKPRVDNCPPCPPASYTPNTFIGGSKEYVRKGSPD